MSFHLYKHLTKKQKITVVDHLMIGAAIVHPLTALPQVYAIYSSHNVSGISPWTWFGFMILGLVFLTYGVLHKIKPLVVTQVLWFVIDLLIVVGVVIYK